MPYKYCICPEGEGIDTYRIWEALYFNIVPIVIRNHYMTILEKKFPIVVLDKWEDLNA